MLFRCSEI